MGLKNIDGQYMAIGSWYFNKINYYSGESLDGQRDGYGEDRHFGHMYQGMWKQDKYHGSGYVEWMEWASVSGLFCQRRKK